ncbi:recombinase family protein [Candidatus Saccharibacteria bacterium]|nr:recombinase family protein [Candidatus Saccharibacteria bacterium]
MALKAPVIDHERKTILVFNPEEQKKQDIGYRLTRKKRVAAYARVSTEQDAQQNSYEAQISFYTDYIKSKPEWEFVDVYADEGISGTSYKKRDGFNRMVKDAEEGKIDLILTKSISRFARNTVDSLTITRKLKAVGVEVFFEKENISSMDAQAELIFTIMSSVAQEESRSISENVRWGKQRSMEAGKVYLPYNSFLGYRKGDDGLPQIVEEEAKIVRDIYKMYLGGMSLNGIADKLNTDGIKTPSGKENCHWTKDGVRRILTNEKYKGDARLQKTYTVDFLTKEVRVNRGERKQWYVHDSHDAIVSPETFELVQKELARRTGRKGRFYDSPFTGKIICGECNAYYGHRVWHSNESCRRNIWLCNEKYTGSRICRSPRVTDEEIMTGFIKAIHECFGDNYLLYCDDYESKFLPLIGETKKLDEQLSTLTSQLNDLTAQIERLIDDNAKKAQNQTQYTTKFNQLNLAIGDRKASINAVEKQISESLTRRENARIFLQGLREADSLFTRFDIKTWHALVDYVKVMPDNTLIYHFRNNAEQTIKLDEVR